MTGTPAPPHAHTLVRSVAFPLSPTELSQVWTNALSPELTQQSQAPSCRLPGTPAARLGSPRSAWRSARSSERPTLPRRPRTRFHVGFARLRAGAGPPAVRRCPCPSAASDVTSSFSPDDPRSPVGASAHARAAAGVRPGRVAVPVGAAAARLRGHTATRPCHRTVPDCDARHPRPPGFGAPVPCSSKAAGTWNGVKRTPRSGTDTRTTQRREGQASRGAAAPRLGTEEGGPRPGRP